jgi:hypothetical protein
MTYLAAFLASALLVGLKSIQQISVIKGRHAWVVPVSYGLAACEITIIGKVARNDGNRLVLALAIGTGAWIGCFAGMALDELIGG